jgi:hypothetical protein
MFNINVSDCINNTEQEVVSLLNRNTESTRVRRNKSSIVAIQPGT